MTWKPISTAPKDTVIDIWSIRDGRLADYIRIEHSQTNVFFDPVKSGPCCIRDATHWMPIPDAPKEQL